MYVKFHFKYYTNKIDDMRLEISLAIYFFPFFIIS